MMENTGKKFHLFMYLASILVYGFCCYLLLFARETDFVTYFGAIFFCLLAGYFSEKMMIEIQKSRQKWSRFLLALPFFLISSMIIYKDYYLEDRIEMLQIQSWVFVISIVKLMGFVFGFRILLLPFFQNDGGENRLK